MAQPTIRTLRALVRSRRFLWSRHAQEELGDDTPATSDCENIILTGQITERQVDRRTGQHKYVVQGCTSDSVAAEAVVKLEVDGTLLVITAYRR
jgi:hypothetical protein